MKGETYFCQRTYFFFFNLHLLLYTHNTELGKKQKKKNILLPLTTWVPPSLDTVVVNSEYKKNKLNVKTNSKSVLKKNKKKTFIIENKFRVASKERSSIKAENVS